jgi:hypothetical protein
LRLSGIVNASRDMPIEAICPSGHKILCPDDRAGRAAKCPRCGAAFRIPGTPVTAHIAGVGGEGSSAAIDVSIATPKPDRGESTVTGAAGTGDSLTPANGQPVQPTFGAVGSENSSELPPPLTPTGDELIVFLCPNGHKLNGPARLAGKTGQCPHCGARFEIPFPEEVENSDEHDGLADTVTEDPLQDYLIEQRASASGNDDDMPLEVAHLFEAVRADAESSVVSRFLGRSGKGAGNTGKETPAQPAFQRGQAAGKPDSTNPGERHPLANLVARLWEEREHGGIIELHLKGGTILVPEWFEANLSRGSHGLFAAQAADGTVTMTVVPWDEVTRVVVRGVVGLPDGMFE